MSSEQDAVERRHWERIARRHEIDAKLRADRERALASYLDLRGIRYAAGQEAQDEQ